MSEWDEMADGWDEDPAVVAYSGGAWRALEEAVELGEGMRVLDFGCGTGLLTERLAQRVREVVAVDASPKMIEVLDAKNLSNVQALAATWTPDTIADEPLAAEPFDLIVRSSVCAFLPDYPGTVAMFAGLLAPGGRFVQWDWELDPNADEPFGLTAAAIEGAIGGSGLDVVSVGVGFDVAFEGMRMRPLMGVGRAKGGEA